MQLGFFVGLNARARWLGWASGVIAVAWLLRLVLSSRVELLPEEAYYWNYSRHLDFGYLDHPPMVAWLIRLGTSGFGSTEFGVRAGSLCCGLISSVFIFRLTRDLFGEAAAWVAAVLVQTLPFFFLTGFLMTPDAPLTAAWAAALYFLERSLLGERTEAWWGVGICIGLGLLSKYSIGLLGLSTLVFMALDGRARQWFGRWLPYSAALLALAFFSPVIIWNAHHEWASFVFQTSRRLAESPRFSLHKLLASWMVLLTPTGLVFLVYLLAKRVPRAVHNDPDEHWAWRFIQVMTGVPLAMFLVFSFRHEVKLDWAGAPLTAALPALACGIVRSGTHGHFRGKPWVCSAWIVTIATLLLVYAGGGLYLTLGVPWMGYSRHTELLPVGWRQFGIEIDAIVRNVERTAGTTPLVVGLDRYAIASELAFYAPDQLQSVATRSSGHLFGQVGLMYEQWFPPQTQVGRTMLLVSWDPHDLATRQVLGSVHRMDPIREQILTLDGMAIRPYYYRLVYDFREPAY